MGDQRRKDKLGKKNKENRTTKDQEEQQDGEQDGSWESYHENGELEFKGFYKDGKIVKYP